MMPVFQFYYLFFFIDYIVDTEEFSKRWWPNLSLCDISDMEPHSEKLIFVTSWYWGNSLLTGTSDITSWTRFLQPPTNLSKLCLDFSAGTHHACSGVLVHALLQILPNLCIWVFFLCKVRNCVMCSGFVMIGSWQGHGAKGKTGKHSWVPWSDTAWDLTYESKYLCHIYTSLWHEVVNVQQLIITSGMSFRFCIDRNPKIVLS